MTDQPSSEKSIFLAALERAPEDRAAYLDQACGGDPRLRAEVEALLAAHDRLGGSPTEPPESAVPSANAPPAGERTGSVIGPYKLLQLIGEGGMGVVWMVEQQQPVRRRVALKVIKPGMDSAQVLARFEAERQALALMDHPHIAKVFDAGATDNGRPYFAMELVKGLPLTTYCDQRRLTPKERLELFVPVCQAVQHAHQKGIIHRDLKPSNVLVAPYDGKPVPKVIDFGIAKATGPKLTERTLFTEFGAVVGTLEYMSPEQAELNNQDIDMRSDIYSLGVLLYELLTGTTPLERKRLKSTALLEVLRLIREEEPQRPSTRLSTTEKLRTIAAQRSLEPRKLRGLVRGELDWIVMKCLEKDRSRRYQTANDLAWDVARYLADEPIQACPPSAAYRFVKFARRNKGPMLAGLLVLLALLAGTAASLWQAVRATLAEKQARFAQGQAEANLRKADQAVHDYFTVVSESTLLNEPALEPLRKQLLHAALRYYQNFVHEHSDDPELQAELAATYLRICLLTHTLDTGEDWLPAFQKGVAIVEDRLAKGADVLGFQGLQRGIFWMNTGVGFHVRQPDECLRAFEKTRNVWEELIRANPTAPGLRNDLALFYLVIGMLQEGRLVGIGRESRPAEAVPALQRSCDLLQQLIQTTPSVPYYRAMLAISLGNLGMSYAFLGQFPQAEKAGRDALETAQKLIAEFPTVAGWRDLLTGLTCWHYGWMMEHGGRLEEAVEAARLSANGQADLSQMDAPWGLSYASDS